MTLQHSGSALCLLLSWSEEPRATSDSGNLKFPRILTELPGTWVLDNRPSWCSWEESHCLPRCWELPWWWVLFGEHKDSIDISTYPFPSTSCLWYCSCVHCRTLATQPSHLPVTRSSLKTFLCKKWTVMCVLGALDTREIALHLCPSEPSPSEAAVQLKFTPSWRRHIMPTRQWLCPNFFLFLYLGRVGSH